MATPVLVHQVSLVFDVKHLQVVFECSDFVLKT